MTTSSKTFLIRDSFPCFVTYTYRTEATDEDEALENYYNSQATCVGHEIGECIPFLDQTDIEVVEATEKGA